MSVRLERRARAGGLTYRPVRADELRACAEIWRTSINDYIGRLGQAEIPPEIEPAPPPVRATSSRPIPSGSSSRPSAPAGDRRSERVVAFAVGARRASGSGTSRCCSCCPSSRARASGGPAGPGAAEPTAGDRPWRPRPTAPSRSRTRCTRRYGIVPRMPLLNLIGPARATRGVRRRCRRASCRSPFETIAAGRRAARAIGSWPTRSTRSTASCSASPTRSTTGSCARRSRRGWLYRGPDGAPVGYGYAARPGGSGRSRSATPTSSARSSAT